MSKTYNGWYNYETWRVNLELFDGMTVEDMGHTFATAEDFDTLVDKLTGSLEAYAYDIADNEASGWALGLAHSFLDQVDYREIAEHMVNDRIAEELS